MYFIMRGVFCQPLFEIIFVLFEKECLFFASARDFLSFHLFRNCFSPERRLRALSALHRDSCNFPQESLPALLHQPKNCSECGKSAFFMIFLVSLLRFLCYNNLTICFNLCPCRGTGALRRASIGRRAAGFSLQRDTTEGRSYETGKRGNS